MIPQFRTQLHQNKDWILMYTKSENNMFSFSIIYSIYSVFTGIIGSASLILASIFEPITNYIHAASRNS